ncbi:MAG: DUF305 domain-containing protein, partial [Ktedonobacteraceae bacterium]|nr:DUF305 domain-containing protein [Ktedonobacteraceae bacterium]
MKRSLPLLMLGVFTSIILAAGSGSTTHAMQNMRPHGYMATPAAPFDARFIDSMIQHHQGAIDMAKRAQAQAQHNKIKTLASSIITSQQNEITSLRNWRHQWYPHLAPTSGMHMP